MKKTFGILLVCAVLMGGLFPGAKAEGSEGDQRHLRISATVNADAGFTSIPLEQGNYKELSLLNLENVTIDLDGAALTLEDALREGRVTPEQLVAWARLDASEGLCNEVAKSKNNLTEFTYRYPKFGYTLRSIYDLFEAPNGGQYLIADVIIYAASDEPRHRLPMEDEDVIIYTTADEPHYLLPVDEQTGYPIDYEDWGLTFEVSKADSTGLTVTCTQSGGQQLGTLEVQTQWLERKNPDTLAWENVEETQTDTTWTPPANGPLTMGGTSSLFFDFAEPFGSLPAGEYRLTVEIADHYNEAEVHPLMRNYRDVQWYTIEFTIE